MKLSGRAKTAWPLGLVLTSLFLAQLYAQPTTPISTAEQQSGRFHADRTNNARKPVDTLHNNPVQNLATTLQTLRDEYARIVAKFKALRYECRSNMRIRVNDAIADATKWKHTVDVLGLLEEITVDDLSATEKELIVRERFAAQGLTGEALEARVRAFNLNNLGSISASESQLIRVKRMRERGMTEQQIAEALQGDEAIRRELRPMYDNLDHLIWESLRNAYEKAYQCCLCGAQDFWPPMMASLFRELSLIDEAAAVKIGSVEKNLECARAVERKTSGGAGWRGTITFKSNYEYKFQGQKANNVSYINEHSQYDATFQVDGRLDQYGKPLARMSATAEETKINGGRGTTGCYRISEQKYETRGSASDDNSSVTINLDPRSGEYSITYLLAEVKGSGEHHVTSKTAGTCNNPFNKPVDSSDPLEDYPIESGPTVEIAGTVEPDSADQLVGSKTVTVRGRDGGERKITVTWNLLYCRK
jgi:hypothetical protein